MHLRSTSRRLASTAVLVLPVAITASGLAVAIDHADDPAPVGRGSATDGERAGSCAHLVPIPATTSAVLAPGCPDAGEPLDVGGLVVSALGTGPTAVASDFTGHCLPDRPARHAAPSTSVGFRPAQASAVRFASVPSGDGPSAPEPSGDGPSAAAPSTDARASSPPPGPTGRTAPSAPTGSGAQPGSAVRAPSAGGAASQEPPAGPTEARTAPEPARPGPIARAVPAIVEQTDLVALPPAPPEQRDATAPAWAPPAPVLGSTLAALHHA